jgi:class 3 adenylate cyclase
MAKFLRVGVHHSNVSGYTSKAWTIGRTGSTVLLKWGSVEVRGVGHGRRIYWAGRPRQKAVRFGSEKQARDYVKRAIARRRGHRYEELLATVRIRRGPVRRRVEPRRVLATVLFVDIVRSTDKAALLGDRRWNQVLSHYYAALRRELRVSRGKRSNHYRRRNARNFRPAARGGEGDSMCGCDASGRSHSRSRDQGGLACRRV